MKQSIAEDHLINTILDGVYKNAVPEHYFPLAVKILAEKGIPVEVISKKLKHSFEAIAKGLAEYMEIEGQQLDQKAYDQDKSGYNVIQFPAGISVDGDVKETSILIEKKLVENYLKFNL